MTEREMIQELDELIHAATTAKMMIETGQCRYDYPQRFQGAIHDFTIGQFAVTNLNRTVYGNGSWKEERSPWVPTAPD